MRFKIQQLMASNVGVLFCIIASGCGENVSTMKFPYVSASIKTSIQDKTGGYTKKLTNITDRDQLRRLLEYFPEFGKGKTGGTPSGWEASVIIRFTRQDGTTFRVTSNYKLWSEGDGDWPIQEGCIDFIKTLIKSKKE